MRMSITPAWTLTSKLNRAFSPRRSLFGDIRLTVPDVGGGTAYGQVTARIASSDPTVVTQRLNQAVQSGSLTQTFSNAGLTVAPQLSFVPSSPSSSPAAPAAPTTGGKPAAATAPAATAPATSTTAAAGPEATATADEGPQEGALPAADEVAGPAAAPVQGTNPAHLYPRTPPFFLPPSSYRGGGK